MYKHSNLVSFVTLCRHQIVRILRIWPQTLVPPIITTGLYYIIFGNVMGAKIGAIHGVPYVQYIMPGLVMMSIIDNSYVNVVSAFFTAKFFRSIEEMLVTPMSNHAILCGFVIGGMLRGIVIGIMVALLSLLFTKISVYNWPLTILMVLLTSAFLALIGFVNGVFARKFDDLSIVPTFILAPLSFFGGVFYSVRALPEVWQAATHANPIFYMIGGFRYAILGTSDVGIYYPLIMLSIGTVFFYFVCYTLLRKGIGIKY